MLLVAVSSARFARRNLDIIDCGGFLLLSAAEPSMMKSFFIIEGSRSISPQRLFAISDVA